MAHVCICLATYNGAEFIDKQLTSIVAQTHQDWSLLISDDGSNDSTLEIVREFIEANPSRSTHVLKGPAKGYARNFLSILCHPKAKGDYYAFADQDDIWLPDKLSEAIKALELNNYDGPKLYGARTTIIDGTDTIKGSSPLFSKSPSFRNALVQSIAGGNTMLMNRKARNIVRAVGKDVQVVSHDWWVYLLVSGCGGKVIYDPNAQVLYRNHGKNLIGSNMGLKAKYRRLIAVLQNRFSDWNSQNEVAIQKAVELLTPENQNVLRDFSIWRKYSGLRSLLAQRRIGLYRQTRFGTMTLALAGFLGKV